jgi:hypothetical protein
MALNNDADHFRDLIAANHDAGLTSLRPLLEAIHEK